MDVKAALLVKIKYRVFAMESNVIVATSLKKTNSRSVGLKIRVYIGMIRKDT